MYTAIFKKQSNGTYFAQCEQIPAAMTQGSTIDEAKENLKDAIQLVLEDERDNFRNSHQEENIIRGEIVMA